MSWFRSKRDTSISGARAYSLKALTISFIASTCCTIVCVARSSICASPSLIEPRSLRRMRSADSWIGVSGFLISCARRRATSPHAASRCACSSAVMSSNTMTKPPGLRSSPDSVVQAHMRMRRPDSPCSTSCSRHSVWPASRCALQASSNCSNNELPLPASASGLPMTLSTSAPRIVQAAWFAVRTVRSGSSEMTPVDRRARMTARLARSASTACWLRRVSSRARASRFVMSLNE